MQVRIGVLCLQGAFREHISQLRRIQFVVPVEVRTKEELFSVHGLVIPGGESTTMAWIAQQSGLMESLIQFRTQGRPIWGTCAGLILLAEKIEGQKKGGQACIGGLDIHVCRNFFGAQVQSFELEMEPPACLLPFGNAGFRSVFIRAPGILEIGDEVEVLCELELSPEQKGQAGRDRVIVAVKSGTCLGTAFHPELSEDNRWHQLFADIVVQFVKAAGQDLVSQGEKTESLFDLKVPSDLPVFGKEHMIKSVKLED